MKTRFKPLKTIAHPHQSTRTLLALTDTPIQPLGLSPYLIGDLPDESKLLLLVLQRQGIAGLMSTETALRAKGDTLQGLLFCLPASFRDEISCFVDPLLDLLLVLQFS